MKVLGLHHVSISVSDLERGVHFYTQLGLEPIAGANEAVRWFRLGRNELHLIVTRNAIPRHQNEADPHFALEVDDIKHVASLITAAGGEVLQEPRQRPHDGSWYLFALDPDGNRFEVTKHTEDWHLRNDLVDDLLRKKVLTQPRVEGALRRIARHLFLPNHTVKQAYQDDAIMTKQQGEATSSSSQPAIVAIMLEQLNLQPGERVLEIGAGTGWNAALMAHLVGATGRIITIDIDEDTVAFARENLARAGVNNVEVICADGGFGHNDGAPYDAIIATAGIADISPHWLEQLREGGRFLAPLWFNTLQFCSLFVKEDGKLVSRDFHHAGFMPLRGEFAGRQTGGFEQGVYIAADHALKVDGTYISHLLHAPARELCLLPLKEDDGFKCVQYLALRGESMASVQLSQPSGPRYCTALVTSASSMVLWDGSWWGQSLAKELTVYGDGSSLVTLQRLVTEWQAQGRPGLQEAKITAALPDTIAPTPEAFVLRKQWMEYHISFEKQNSPPQEKSCH